MADIDLERKRGGGMSWLWWVLGLLLLAAVIWWVWPSGDEELAGGLETEPTGEVQPLPEPAPEMVGEQPGVSVAEIIESPATYTGQTLTSEVQVTEVPTDRGFWIEDQGERLFVIIIDQPQEQPQNIQPNTTVRLQQAVVRDPTYLANLPGAPLDSDTESIARNQDVFLTVDEANIVMMGQGEGAMQGGGGM